MFIIIIIKNKIVGQCRTSIPHFSPGCFIQCVMCVTTSLCKFYCNVFNKRYVWIWFMKFINYLAEVTYKKYTYYLCQEEVSYCSTELTAIVGKWITIEELHICKFYNGSLLHMQHFMCSFDFVTYHHCLLHLIMFI